GTWARAPALHVDRGHGVRDHVVQLAGDAQPLLVHPPAGVLLGPVVNRRHVGPPVGDRDPGEQGGGAQEGDQVEPAAAHLPERVPRAGGHHQHDHRDHGRCRRAADADLRGHRVQGQDGGDQGGPVDVAEQREGGHCRGRDGEHGDRPAAPPGQRQAGHRDQQQRGHRGNRHMVPAELDRVGRRVGVGLAVGAGQQDGGHQHGEGHVPQRRVEPPPPRCRDTFHARRVSTSRGSGRPPRVDDLATPPGVAAVPGLPEGYRQVPTTARRLSTPGPGTLSVAGGSPAGGMNQEAPMPALTRFVLRHKLLVALFWVVVAAAGVMTISGTTHRMTNNFAMPGQAFRVDNQIAAEYGNGGSQTPYVPVITVAPGQRVTDPAVAAATGRAFAAVARAVPDVRIADYYTTHDRAFVARDGRSTFALVYTAPVTGFGGPTPRPRPPPAVAPAAPAAWHPGVTGSQLLQNGKPAAKGTGVMAEVMIGSVGALVILALVFASFLAFLPLIIGGISVLATFLIVGGLTEVTGVSQIVEFLIALIGLGVAIDYSLLVVSRWREERAAGRDNHAAVTVAMNHAGHAVVFSGLTVAIGLLSMIVLPVPMLRSVGYAGVLVPLGSGAGAITLLPVTLASVGPRLDWPRLRTERRASRVFSAWAGVVYRHRWAAAIAGLGIMTALALPALTLHLGEPGSAAQAT